MDHSVHGQGGPRGPNLFATPVGISTMLKRIQDIQEPSVTITKLMIARKSSKVLRDTSTQSYESMVDITSC